MADPRPPTTPALYGWGPRLDRLVLWTGAAILSILIAYGPSFLTYAPQFISPGYRFFSLRGASRPRYTVCIVR